MLLDNAMFDDGSILYRNFTVSTSESYYTCEYPWIQKKFSKEIERINKAVRDYNDYIIVCDDDGIRYELSWD